MEDVLDLYAEPADSTRPRVCLDERPTQLVAETRSPLPPAPGRRARQDYEYERRGSCPLFLLFSPDTGWREVVVRERRMAADAAAVLRHLVDEVFPTATVVRLVVDQLNIHSPAVLYAAFPAPEARRIARKLEWHYTPTHASWLNMAELEFSALVRQCLGRRIGSREELERVTAAWATERNERQVSVHWQFTTERARDVLQRHYPS